MEKPTILNKNLSIEDFAEIKETYTPEGETEPLKVIARARCGEYELIGLEDGREIIYSHVTNQEIKNWPS